MIAIFPFDTYWLGMDSYKLYSSPWAGSLCEMTHEIGKVHVRGRSALMIGRKLTILTIAIGL